MAGRNRKERNLRDREEISDITGSLEVWVKGTTGGAGLTAPWQAGAGSLGPPELTTPLCTSVASSIEPPHPSTCSHGATVRITRLDAGKGLRPVSGTPLSAAGRKWPQDTKPTPAALQKQQGDQKKSQGSTQGRLKVAE